VVNETEISDTAWVSINAVKEWLSDDDVNTSPWFALEWELITTDFAEHLTKTKP
jgi:isopentenyldiphosphate isomerase